MSEAADNMAENTRQRNITRILDAAERLFATTATTNQCRRHREGPRHVAGKRLPVLFEAEIHQGAGAAHADAGYEAALAIARCRSVPRRVSAVRTSDAQYTVETMPIREGQEMVVVAIGRWPVIDAPGPATTLDYLDHIRDGSRLRISSASAESAGRCFSACHAILIIRIW